MIHLADKSKPFLEKNDLHIVIHILIISTLDFCNVLIVKLSLTTFQRIQLEQIGYNLVLHAIPIFTLVLESLYLFLVSFRTYFNILVFDI